MQEVSRYTVGDFRALKVVTSFRISTETVSFTILYFCDDLVYVYANTPAKFGRIRKEYYGDFVFVVKDEADIRFTKPNYSSKSIDLTLQSSSVHSFYRAEVIPVFNPRDFKKTTKTQTLANGYTRLIEESEKYPTPVIFPSMEDTMANLVNPGIIISGIKPSSFLNSSRSHDYIPNYHKPPEGYRELYLADFVSEMLQWLRDNRKLRLEQHIYWLDQEAARAKLDEDETLRRHLNKKAERLYIQEQSSNMKELLSVL